jgi:hypothetical protein
MRNELITFVMCCTVASAVAQPEDAPKAAGQPKIQFDRTVYDFGVTSLVQSVTGTFTFQNAGEADLQLQKPAPSCGCTVASVKPDHLKPGEKGELVFTVNLGNARGSIEKHITVPSNDPQSPSISLTIKADMRQLFQATPESVQLGTVRQGVVTNIVVELRRLDGKSLNVSKTDATGSLLHTKFEPVAESEGKAARILIEVAAEGVPRPINDTVHVYVDDQVQPAANIQVYGRLLGPISLSPAELYWGVPDAEHWQETKSESVTTRRVIVESTEAQPPLELTNVTSDVKELSVSVVPVEVGKTYSLVATLSEPPKASLRGTINFETNQSSQPRVSVPVVINVFKR